MSPSDVTFAFCVPTTLQEYRTQVALPHCFEWARQVTEGSEALFKEILLRPHESFVRQATSRGARIVTNLAAGTIGTLFDPQSVGAIVILAHCNGSFVELGDGLAPIGDVVRSVPSAYGGIIDLSMCNGEVLARRLRQACPRLRPIRYSEGKINYALWLDFYLVLLAELQRADVETYWDAFAAAICDFAAMASESKR